MNMTTLAIDTIRKFNHYSDDRLQKIIDNGNPGDIKHELLKYLIWLDETQHIPDTSHLEYTGDGKLFEICKEAANEQM